MLPFVTLAFILVVMYVVPAYPKDMWTLFSRADEAVLGQWSKGSMLCTIVLDAVIITFRA